MATNAPQDDWHKTGLRMPRELHERLHEAAAESGRSYNAEIVARLQASFTEPTHGVDRDVAIASSTAEAMMKALDRANEHGKLLLKKVEAIEARVFQAESLQPVHFGGGSIVQGPAPKKSPAKRPA